MRVSAPLFFALLDALSCANFLASAAIQPPVTIEDILAGSESVSIAPVWAPDGSSFVYLRGGAVYRMKAGSGKPVLWFEVAALSEARPERKPASSEQPYGWRNRRVSEEPLQWFPDSKDLLVEESGSIYIAHGNRSPEPVALDALAEDPHLAPDGKSVLYRSQHNLFVLDLATSRSRQLTRDGSGTLLNGELDWVYPEELGLGEAAWWSPNSASIAFLQFDVSDEFVYPQASLLGVRAMVEPERYPQAGTPNARVRLGVIDLASGAITWMKAGDHPDTLLARVAWLPDSSAVALETAPRIQNELNLVFCDPGSGEVRIILHESAKTWINIEDNLRFLKSRREFLWTSERSGFRHIYRYSLSGEQLGQLTSGDWEVRGIAAVDEPGARVYYLSAEDSPLETHLYAVGLDGAARTRLTMQGADHNVDVEPGGRFFTDTFSNLSEPPETVLRSMAGRQITALYSRAKKNHKMRGAAAELVRLKASDGTLLYGLLQKPPDFVEGRRYPVIVKVYGGPQAQSVRNAWRDLDMDAVYTSNGYVVWELDNRGSAGRGHGFEEPVYHNLGSVEVADQRTGAEYLIKRGIADPKRIGVTGWSYGGYMTIRCLLLAPDIFKAGAAGAPVTDWHNYDTIYTERYMGLPSHNVAGYATSSNLASAGKLAGKLLIQHNLEDDNVLFQNTMQFVNALEQANKQYALQLYPLKTHGVTGDLRRPLYAAQLDFFNRNLQ